MDETLVHDPKERITNSPVRVAAVVDQPGTLLGDYRISRKIAAGGMGEVYEAIQLKLDRRVALKLVGSHLAGNPHFLQRFEREAKAAAALNHPNIVQVYDFGCVDGQYYLAMEYVDGQDLGELLATKGKLEIANALGIIEQTAHALESARQQQIIHRDIKPSNLLLTKTGNIKVSDLGLAKRLDDITEVTMTGASLGSPHFLAPEQADDARTVDHRADIYALGITLLYLVTGKRPFDHSSALSIVLAHAQKPLPTGLVLGTPLPAEVETLVQKMAAKRPEDRYQTYDELLGDVARVKQGGKPAASVRHVSRRRISWFVVGATALVAAAGLIWLAAVRAPAAGMAQKQNPADGPLEDRPQEHESQLVNANREGRGGPPPERPRGGGPRRRDEGNTFPLPMPRPMPPQRSAIADGPVPMMLAAADAYAKTNTEAYRGIIDRYAQVEEKARGTQWEGDVVDRIESAVAAHQSAAQRALTDYRSRMQKLALEEKFLQAYNVWQDFPATLRTWELDRQIEQILSEVLPLDFRPPPPH